MVSFIAITLESIGPGVRVPVRVLPKGQIELSNHLLAIIFISYLKPSVNKLFILNRITYIK